MSQVVRISETIYKRLESLARGFDTPGSVIERLLDFYKKSGGKLDTPPPPRIKVRLSRGEKTPSKDYYQPILKALVDLGGRASVHEVLNRVERAMKPILKEKDRESLPSNPNELRWVNTAKWARKDMTMMKPPLLKPNSPKTIWEITEAGRKFLVQSNQ